MAVIDYEKVCAEEDRSWTPRLIEVVRSLEVSDAERDQALAALAHLEDPRSIAPLTDVVEDLASPEAVRDSVSKVLAGFDDGTTSERRRAWWGTQEPVLMAHALRLMARTEADIVLPVAGDDAHPLQHLALLAMTWGFEEPQFQTVKIRALSHGSAEIRSTAAFVLMWDEPVAAEHPLLDAAVDASSEVAISAIETLQYYPSRRVLRALADLSATEKRDEVRATAVESLAFSRGRFEHVATHGSEKQKARVREWMRPVADIVGCSEAAAELQTLEWPAAAARVAVSERDLVALIAEADGRWAPKKQALRRVDWDRFATGERARLGDILVSHGDPGIREVAARALAAWGRSDLLLGLIADPCFAVRKSAMYELGHVPRDERLAAPAWEYMLGAAETTAHEALQAYVTHAPAAEARERLRELAHSDRRESIRARAVSSLVALEAASELESLIPLLRDAPDVTWAVHVAIIDGIRALGLTPPNLGGLAEVDNLDLIESIIALDYAIR